MINDYLSTPARRGDNQFIPFRHGGTFVKKFYDERTISLGVAVIADDLAAMETALDTLRAAFAPMTEQVLEVTMEDASVRQANAIVDSSISVELITQRVAKVVIDFKLSYPFFRLSTAIADTTTTIDASPHAMVVDNPGTVEERDPTIIFTGPLTDPVITNSTNGKVLTYTGAIETGHTVTISTNTTGEYIAVHSIDGNVIGNVTHSGDTALMTFDVGESTLAITSDVATTGTVEVTFKAPFL
jgi:hypothetical protein